MNAAITPYLPNSVNLYYVDYRDDLSEHSDLLEETLRKNSLDPICEKVSDWLAEDSITDGYIDEIRTAMEDEGYELTDDDEEEIRDWLYEKDTSDPVSDLLKNTGKLSMFYSLGLEVEGWSEAGFFSPSMRYSSEAQEAYKVRRILGIKKDTKEAKFIDSIVANASYGGELRIYFNLDLEEALSGEVEKDFKQIQFNGKYAVAVYNNGVGSGDFEYMELNKTFPFIRDNLYTSDADKYSIERCFGMCGDWLDKTATPMMSIEPLKKKAKIKKSENTARIAQENKYKQIFNAGGCTKGDMDYTRHRDVYYKNEIPCGSHCPHCGTFWID